MSDENKLVNKIFFPLLQREEIKVMIIHFIVEDHISGDFLL